MAKVRISVNRNGVGEILKSDKVRAELERRAQAIADSAGEGFEADSLIGATRARASVRTASFEAMQAEAKDRVLTRAIEAGRA